MRVGCHIRKLTVTVSGTLGQDVVTEEIRIGSREVRVANHWQSASSGSLMVTYPALTTDGRSETAITVNGNRVTLHNQSGGGVAFEILEPAGTVLSRSGLRIKHPNGFVEPIQGTVTGNRIVYRIQPASAQP